MPVSAIPPRSAVLALRRTQSDPDFKTHSGTDQGALQRRSSAPAQLQPRVNNKAHSAESPQLPRPDPALSAERLEAFKQLQRKRAGLPYTPSKGDSTVNLNGTVDLPDEIPDSVWNTTVLCRHLSTQFVLQQGKKRLLVEQFRTKEGIEAVFKGKLASVDATYHSMLKAAAQHSKHLVNEQHFGAYVSAVAQALAAQAESGGPASVNTFLLSEDHAMALHVERKTKDGQITYNAKVFDPNLQGNYKRAPINVPTPQALAHLQFEDFLIDPEAAAVYAPANASLTLFAVCVEEALNLHLPQLHFCPLNLHNNIPTASNLYLILSGGMHEGLAAMAQWLTEHADQLPKSKLVELLAAKADDGVPGLSTAMARGETQTVQCFADMLVKLAIPIADQVKLLAAKTDYGHPGLSAALVNGEAQTVRCFGQILAKSAIPVEDQISLLAAKTDDGWCSLRGAVQNGHVNTIRAFIQAIEVVPVV